jgi:hypothetical protein
MMLNSTTLPPENESKVIGTLSWEKEVLVFQDLLVFISNSEIQITARMKLSSQNFLRTVNLKFSL